MADWKILKARNALADGGIIAYPTETVFGLGCDPQNEAALVRLMVLKGRRTHNGFIIIGHDWEQLLPLVQAPSKDTLKKLRAKSKRPTTWVFPARAQLPSLVYGDQHTLAMRVTSHPSAAAICEQFGPIVSTSANFHGDKPKTRYLQVLKQFNGLVDYVVAGDAGPFQRPSEIRDARTGKLFRS